MEHGLIRLGSNPFSTIVNGTGLVSQPCIREKVETPVDEWACMHQYFINFVIESGNPPILPVDS